MFGLGDVAVRLGTVDVGLSAGIHLPFFFSLGLRSSFDDKRRMMEAFAEKVLRHFPAD